jgi:hypothetical protein
MVSTVPPSASELWSVRTSRPLFSPAHGPVSLVRRAFRHWQTFLVVAYTVAAFTWTIPASLFPPKTTIDGMVAGPFLLLGLWQAWDMFSPDPRATDICVEMRCTDRDGTVDRRMLTDMVAMGYLERWQKDRWRKYFNDHLRLDDEQRLWQPFTEYAVRRLREEGHDPEKIELVRWWRPCEPAVRPEWRADVRQTPWNSYMFHRWAVPRERDQ